MFLRTQTVRRLSPLARGVHIEAKIEALGYKMPAAPASPKGNYIPFVKSGNFVFLAGHLPQSAEGTLTTGRLGESLTVEQGQAAARVCGLNLLASLKAACDGDLDKIKRIVKLVGFVNSTPDFTQQPAVMNGCSDLMAEIFGDKGRHARSAVGTNTLPLGVAVEVEAIVELEN